MNAQKRPARDLLAAERAIRAMNMRKLGYGYPAIAAECGYADKATAYNAVQRELARTLQQPADDVRKMEAERLDDLLRAMMPKALKGDTWSVDRVLSIMERRAKLLGLDTPAKDAVSVAPIIREYPEGLASAV